MDDVTFMESKDLLRNLMNLPSDVQLVRTLSGGERWRLSLAGNIGSVQGCAHMGEGVSNVAISHILQILYSCCSSQSSIAYTR